MPEPFRSEHNDYIAGYLKTGIAKVIGLAEKLNVVVGMALYSRRN